MDCEPRLQRFAGLSAELDEVGVKPDDIAGLDDLRRLPFTAAKDLAEDYLFPLLCSPMSEVVRIHASSGTNRKRKVLCYTQKDIDDWSDFFARCFEMAELTLRIGFKDPAWARGLDRRNRVPARMRKLGPWRCRRAQAISRCKWNSLWISKAP